MLDIIDEYGLDEDGNFQAFLECIRELAEQEISDLAGCFKSKASKAKTNDEQKY